MQHKSTAPTSVDVHSSRIVNVLIGMFCLQTACNCLRSGNIVCFLLLILNISLICMFVLVTPDNICNLLVNVTWQTTYCAQSARFDKRVFKTQNTQRCYCAAAVFDRVVCEGCYGLATLWQRCGGCLTFRFVHVIHSLLSRSHSHSRVLPAINLIWE